MTGPCPQGARTATLHEAARCRDRGRCTGPGCRVRRDLRVVRTEPAEAEAA